MVWDYSEANAFNAMAGDLLTTLTNQARVLELFHQVQRGYAFQQDARSQEYERKSVISTDPPYYDNIGYADLGRLNWRPTFDRFLDLVAHYRCLCG